MPEGIDFERYLTAGAEKIVKQLVKSAAFHPKEAAFMAKYAIAAQKSAALRQAAEKRGEHVPPFLIASITSVCNLHCAGCYARSLEACVDGTPEAQLSAQEWGKVFESARDMGVGFILLAGGEPMVRRDVISEAASFPELLFPIFTNGTLLNDEYLSLFDRSRNLIPILSLEGGQAQTDARRGAGMFQKLRTAMEQMEKHRLIFGASVTVTSENLAEVTSDAFLKELESAGCKGVIYVEFVPTNEDLRSLALDDAGREQLAGRLAELRERDEAMLLISFPGDEKSSGGCLAAGRGFFHINSHGGAEPCPFSPYSDMNVREHSLKEVLSSPLFGQLREGGFLAEPHDGGCVLYRQRKQVEALLQGAASEAKGKAL